MSIKRSLALFRAETPGVQAAALVDLSTGTVLVSESALPMGQEEFDGLAREARRLLSTGDAGDVNLVAYQADTMAGQLFIRNKAELDDALILVLADTARDPAKLTQAGAAFLAATLGGTEA